MAYTKKQLETFENYRTELLELDSVKNYIRANISGRFRCEAPENLTDSQKLELSALATECLRARRRRSRSKNWYRYGETLGA